MKIHTRTVIDIQSGEILEDSYYEYSGPLERADRALQQQAKDAGRTAAGTGAQLTTAGQEVQSTLVPTLERDITAAPGYDPIGLGEMKTAAESTGAAASGSAAEGMKLRALRTGNIAGVGAGEVASAGETARATGGALQQILAKNAELKARQRESGLKGLESVLGEDIRGGAAQAGLVPEDVKAGAEAGKVGWLQNMTGVMNALANTASAAAPWAKLAGMGARGTTGGGGQ